MERRLFNESERWTLYRMANGICQGCGIELHGVFHADHIKPYSKGGKTEIPNGQVLCERCNMQKSDKYFSEWTMQLRKWQSAAFNLWLSGKSTMLFNATPGAGKTIFGLRCAHHELQSGNCEKVIIVVPSDNLRTQWQEEAATLGINLASDYDASFSLANDYHGFVTTYQTVAARHNTGKDYQSFVTRYRTLSIIDEIHHVGESLNWADGLTCSIGPSLRKLCITGTPFRSDRNPIPFVDYTNTNNGKVCKPDYSYSYGDALRDGYVRPVYFQTFDGDVSWFTEYDELIETAFSEKLSNRLASERMKFAFHHKGGWMQEVLKDANERLNEIRREDPTAGGLIVTRDTEHARQVAKTLQAVTGEMAIIVTSDTDGSREEIKRFRKSNDKWLVAVKMVSEGVDIKRLRVGVWATNIQSELFFRQVVGRIVRMTDEPEEQYAIQYIPKMDPLSTYAESMKVERAHVIDDLDSIADELERLVREREEANHKAHSFFVSSDGQKSDVIHDDSVFSQAEQMEAVNFANRQNIAASPLNIMIIMKTLREERRTKRATETPAYQQPATAYPQKTLEERKKKVKNALGGLRCAIIEASNGAVGHADINRETNHAQGVLTINECSLEQLEERVEILRAWKEAWLNGTGRQFAVKGYLRERASRIVA